MAENFYTILTTVGHAKIANSQVTGQKVDLTEMAVGDGAGGYYNPTQTQTALRNEVWRGNIASVAVDENNPNWIVIEGVIPSSVGGFFVREVGIFDTAGDMIAIGKYPETYKPVTTEGSAKDLYIRMIIEVTNASAVQLKIDPSVIIASRKYVDDKVAPVEQKANQNATSIQQLQQQVNAHLNDTASKFTNIDLNIIDMAVELETLKGATLNGVTANIFIETFNNLNDINLMNGVYDSTNKRLVL